MLSSCSMCASASCAVCCWCSAGAPAGDANAPYGGGAVPAMYGGAEGGFYINRDRQPQVPAAPKQGGFYQRDSRDLEAQLLAQVCSWRLWAPVTLMCRRKRLHSSCQIYMDRELGTRLLMHVIKDGLRLRAAYCAGTGCSDRSARIQSAMDWRSPAAAQHSCQQSWPDAGQRAVAGCGQRGAGSACARPLGRRRATAQRSGQLCSTPARGCGCSPDPRGATD